MRLAEIFYMTVQELLEGEETGMRNQEYEADRIAQLTGMKLTALFVSC